MHVQLIIFLEIIRILSEISVSTKIISITKNDFIKYKEIYKKFIIYNNQNLIICTFDVIPINFISNDYEIDIFSNDLQLPKA